jgi:MerR family redox-sensitive transcriptional activator SoxR
MEDTDLLPIGEMARRAGLATSALRYYERQGLISAVRTSGGQRRYRRNMLRRLAFIRAAQNVGLSLEEIRTALDTLPAQRTPTTAD